MSSGHFLRTYFEKIATFLDLLPTNNLPSLTWYQPPAHVLEILLNAPAVNRDQTRRNNTNTTQNEEKAFLSSSFKQYLEVALHHKNLLATLLGFGFDRAGP